MEGVCSIRIQEQDFLVYEPYCANYNAALELMGTFVAGEMLKVCAFSALPRHRPRVHTYMSLVIDRQ
jgi:hypothetical protein